jgi:hypothetical protein
MSTKLSKRESARFPLGLAWAGTGLFGHAISYKASIELPLLDKQRQPHNEILIQAGKRMKLTANAKLVSVFPTTL